MSPASLNQAPSLGIYRDRASMLAASRAFFAELEVIEVDCPLLSDSAPVDAHIDIFSTNGDTSTYYLHSSPEYGMKRLLIEGMGDLYQLSHVFRKGECGKRHRPEFTLTEWYRLGISLDQMIAETLSYIHLFLGTLPFVKHSYRKTIQQWAGFDYTTASVAFLLEYLAKKGHEPHTDQFEELMNIVLATQVEPQLGSQSLYVMTDYPASAAALAKTAIKGGEAIAKRFEVYYQGVELANGYDELTDPVEHRARFEKANQERLSLGKEALPLDEAFLSALEKGLPSCCGVAVGFDRLMMLRHNCDSIAQVTH